MFLEYKSIFCTPKFSEIYSNNSKCLRGIRNTSGFSLNSYSTSAVDFYIYISINIISTNITEKGKEL